MTTWATQLAAIRAEIEESSSAIWSDTSLLRWHNDAARDFAKKTLYLEDEQYTQSVDGQESYELPDHTIDVTTVYYASGTNPLSRVTIRDFTSNAQFDSDGTPYIYAIHDGALWLWPTPTSSTDNIRFFRTYAPDDLVNTTDTIPFDGMFDDALRNFVKAQAFTQIGDYGAADRFLALYNDEVATTEWETKRGRTADNPLGPRVEW